MVVDKGSAGVGVAGDDTRQATRRATERLREMIVSGELKPDTPLSQVALARDLGISATPIREAIRLLAGDGLLVSEPNHRARVAPLNVEDLDAIYSARVMIESVGIALTARTMSEEELEELEESVRQLRAAADHHDMENWDTVHADFHRRLVVGANPFQAQMISTLFDRSERYRRLSVVESNPRTWTAANAEHEAIAASCRRRDPVAAARELAQHLGRTALMLTASFAPDTDATAVRTAVGMVIAWDG